MNQNLQQIQQWYPDEEENLSNDEMDWQPENEILILPPICEIRYVCDPEPAELGLRRACGIGLDKTDVYQEPPMLGTVMSKGASEAGLCTEKRIGCTIKLDRVLEVPRKGLIYVP